MTNAELVELLEQKTPDELTPEEIELLRSRLAESPELREVMIGQLQLETYLTTALTRVSISPEQVVARARQQTSSGSAGVLIVLGILVCLPLLTLAGAVLMNALRDGQGNEVATAKALTNETEEKAGDTHEIKAPPTKPADENPLRDAILAAQGKPVGAAQKQEAQAPPAVPQPPPSERPQEKPEADAAPAAPSPPPWQAALESAGDPPGYTEVAFRTFDPTKSIPQREDLQGWFDQVPGFNFQLHRVDTRAGPCGAVEGVARLRSPWPEQAVLRLALENYNRLKLHFFHGNQGVTLIYYEDQNFRWAAFSTTREGEGKLPRTWAITGTDDGRASRAELRQGGPIELRYLPGERGGEIMLSRGDIVLVSAALAGPPNEVLVEGRAVVQGIELARAQGSPSLPALRPIAHDLEKPAALDWKSTKPEIAQPEKLPDGGLRLAVDKVKEPVTCYAPLPPGLHDVILSLESVTAGTGVLLANSEGQNHYVVLFYRDRATGRLYATVRNAASGWEHNFRPPQDEAAAVLEPKCWVRLVYGCGILRWWLSTDGQHWAEPEIGLENAPPNLTHIGLHVVKDAPQAGLTMRRVVLRELSGITSLVAVEHRSRAVAHTSAPSLGVWMADVLAKKPAEIASPDWLRACAVNTLAAAAPRELAYPLLEALLDDMAGRDLTIDQRLAALDDALLLCWDLRDNAALRVGILHRIWNVGLAQADATGAMAWSSVRPALQSAAIHTHLVGPLELERSVRAETIQRAYAPQSDDTQQYVRTLRLFQQQRYSPLVDWLESLSARESAASPSGEGLTKIKDGWRDALIEELSKETYDTTTEIQAVLESEAWAEAARLITSVDAEAAPGVAPYIKDRMLLASLPVAVRLTLDDYPQVREALGDSFGPLARLRVGQAIAAGDAATVEMATVQFAGTDAAAEAHQWLGDRALASGWFQRAIAEYRRAIGMIPSLRGPIEPRIRLAAAMLGRDEGSPVMQPVQFNEISMSPAEFEALVTEMRGRGNAGSLAASAVAPAPPALPAAKRYTAEVRSRLDGPIGDRPQEEVGDRRTNQFRVPWADRQLATVVEGDVMYVSNRFQIAAYNLTNGQRMWQSQPPPGPIQRSQEWAMIAMQPLVAGNRIFARQLYSNNPLLACWDKPSGKLLWSAEAPASEFFVSDPVIVQGQLGVLSVLVQTGQLGLMRWNLLDPETGEVQLQRDLVRLRNTWGKRTCCEVAALDDSVVAVLGGITLSVDWSGRLRWVRKHVAVPAEEDPRWVLQRYVRPLVQDGRMYVSQPGVRTVDCLDPGTGRQHWSVVLPEVVGIVGYSTGNLILRTEADLRALDPGNGATLWRYPSPELHSFQLVDESSLLLAARERSPTNQDQWLTRLTWLDAARGEPTATCLVANLVDVDPRLGPLVPYKDRIFTFFGRGQHDPNRDVVELVPAGDAERPLPPSLASDPWLVRIPPRMTAAAFQTLPDWRLVSGGDGDRTGPVPEIHGEKDVLGVRSTGATPIILAREIKLPAMDRPRLRLRLGNDAGQVWKLEVRLGEQVLKTEEIKDETHKDRWKTIEADLSPAAGQAGWLTIRLQSTNGDHVAWWKAAEVVF